VAEIKLLSDRKGVGQDPEGKPARHLHHAGKRVKKVPVGLGKPTAVSDTPGIFWTTVTVTVTKAARVLPLGVRLRSPTFSPPLCRPYGRHPEPGEQPDAIRE
jgi:hypothetical protein